MLKEADRAADYRGDYQQYFRTIKTKLVYVARGEMFCEMRPRVVRNKNLAAALIFA